MKLHAIDLRDAALSHSLRSRLCWLYFDEVYEPAFPIEDEAEDPTVWLPLLANESEPSGRIVHAILAIGDDRSPQQIDASSLLGGLILEYYPISKAALATYLCVKPEMRRHGVAKFLLARAVCTLSTHAEASVVPLFAEAENPGEQADAAAQDLAWRRLTILAHLGFRKVPIKYQQPALGPGKRPLETLEFLAYTGGPPTSVDLYVLRGFMREFYASLGARPPDERRMFGDLTAESMPTLSLIDHGN
jgi:GNAT superfamily N-acetyltransferase